ncbi:MAG: hypothetical protein KDA75_09795 [Planctomycetaceae bacterium]|nr:hypothetical protein [Planctomycetaceae bacterium]
MTFPGMAVDLLKLRATTAGPSTSQSPGQRCGLTVRLGRFAAFLILLSATALTAAPTIHLVIVADTLDRSIGDSVQVDVDMVEEVFRGNVPERQLNIHKLTGNEANVDVWLARIREIKPAAEDALVVYYSGHGAYERQSGHLFAPRGRTVPRAQIVAAIKEQGVRLGVLIGDCCSTLIEVPIPIPFLPPVEEVTPLFDELLIKPRGFVDISATRPGETAMGTAGGGVFTVAFHLLCIQHSQERLHWGDLLLKLNQTTRPMYPRQTAYAVSPLPEGQQNAPAAGSGPAVKRVRLGLQGVDNAHGQRHGGVAVAQVFANMPAQRLRLPGDSRNYHIVPGRDVITHVNGTPVRTNAELVAAVMSSPVRIELTIYDGVTRRTANYYTELK